MSAPEPREPTLNEHALRGKLVNQFDLPATVEVIGFKELAIGKYGKVTEISIKDPNTESIRRYVLKEFIDGVQDLNETGDSDGPVLSSKETVARAKSNHELLQEAGIPTWDFYTVSSDGTSILMPSGFQDDTYCFGYNMGSNGFEDFGQTEIESIESFDDVLDNLKYTALVAAQRGIEIPTDSCMFLMKRTGNEVQMDHIIGDLDAVKRSEMPETQLYEKNTQNLFGTLRFILWRNMNEEVSDRFKAYAEQYMLHPLA